MPAAASFENATMDFANTKNLIQSGGHVAGLDLTSSQALTIRNFHGAAAPKVVIDQHLAMDATGTLRLVFDADPWDSTISFAPGIPVDARRNAGIDLCPDVNLASQIGRTIDLFDWTGVTPTGAFTVSSPYTWNLSKLYTTGEVTLTAIPPIRRRLQRTAWSTPPTTSFGATTWAQLYASRLRCMADSLRPNCRQRRK